METRLLTPDQLRIADAWEGDLEKLRGYEEQLADSEEFCEQTFMSEHEAFVAGLALGADASPEVASA